MISDTLQQLLGLIISAKFKPFILINPPAPSLHLWMWSLKYAPLLHKTWHDSVFYCTDPSLIRQGDKWIHASLWVSVKANTRKKEHAPVVHPLWRVAIQLEHIPKGGGISTWVSRTASHHSSLCWSQVSGKTKADCKWCAVGDEALIWKIRGGISVRGFQ